MNATDTLFYSVKTDKSVEDAVKAVSDALSHHQFGVLWALDINQKLVEKGLEAEPPFHILEVCSAPRAKEALTANQQVGYFLPCKIVVYRDRDSDTTVVGFPKPDVLIGLLKEPRLEGLAREVSELLAKAVDEAVGLTS